MNNRRKLVIALGASTLAVPFRSLAQQAGKVWRIGYLDFGLRQSTLDSGRHAALIEGLRDRGYVEGKNYVLEERHADGDAARLNGFAAELVRQKVDLILSTGGPASLAAKRATTVIPIVVTVATDPVGEGYAASLAHPGGNLTGMATGVEDTVLKLVELLILAVPKLKRMAVIVNSDSRPNLQLLPRIEAAARQAGKQSLPMSVRTPMEIERGFATMTGERGDAAIILPDAFLFSQRALLAKLALKQRVPSINALAGYAEAGGLMSYGLDVNDNFRRVGIFVDKILKGEKPGNIPFEQPTRYYLVVNRKTVNALGIKLNNELLARADRVIE
jgi:putative ABC transport system substrate-binding protein